MVKQVVKASLDLKRKFESEFGQVRDELDVPDRFPNEVLEEAYESVATFETSSVDRIDARHLPLIAIDPPGSTDLDQAFAAEKTAGGYTLFYAIADVAAFLKPGGLVDLQARQRGTTLYSPDTRTPLHPPVISEDKASLLAGTVKPALLWTIELDEQGLPTDWRLERAIVKVSEAITYAEAQRRIDEGVEDVTKLLAEIGKLRQKQESQRGGVSLNLPSQEVFETVDGYHLRFDKSLPVENWNAQISLLAGIVSAQTMLDNGLGIVRTLPAPVQSDIAELRAIAASLGLEWDQSIPYHEFVGGVEPNSAPNVAFIQQAAKTLRGASYQAFGGNIEPTEGQSAGGEVLKHGAIAAHYSHVTAPLRRLVDRFANEILLATYSETEPATWAVEALEELPELMRDARNRDSSLERAMLDLTEAIVLRNRIGEKFSAAVVRVNPKRKSSMVQITDPAIVTTLDAAGLSLGDTVTVELSEVDVSARATSWLVHP